MIELPGPVVLQRCTQRQKCLVEVQGACIGGVERAVLVVAAVEVQRLVEQRDPFGLRKRAAGEQDVRHALDVLKNQIVLADERCAEQFVVHPVLKRVENALRVVSGGEDAPADIGPVANP